MWVDIRKTFFNIIKLASFCFIQFSLESILLAAIELLTSWQFLCLQKSMWKETYVKYWNNSSSIIQWLWLVTYERLKTILLIGIWVEIESCVQFIKQNNFCIWEPVYLGDGSSWNVFCKGSFLSIVGIIHRKLINRYLHILLFCVIYQRPTPIFVLCSEVQYCTFAANIPIMFNLIELCHYLAPDFPHARWGKLYF